MFSFRVLLRDFNILHFHFHRSQKIIVSCKTTGQKKREREKKINESREMRSKLVSFKSLQGFNNSSTKCNFLIFLQVMKTLRKRINLGKYPWKKLRRFKFIEIYCFFIVFAFTFSFLFSSEREFSFLFHFFSPPSFFLIMKSTSYFSLYTIEYVNAELNLFQE